MKAATPILIIGLMLIVFSCRKSNEIKTRVSKPKDTTTAVIDNSKQEQLNKSKEIDEDSINFEKILIKAVKIAEQNGENRIFKKSYEEMMPDSSYRVSVEIHNSYFFTKKHRHLIIRRKIPLVTYIDIFAKSNNQFRKVLSHDESDLTYVNDTIQDVNGDGLSDFVVNWYGSSGCCLKAFSNVYLLNQDGKSFLKDIEFINPTFSPKEKVVRGVCYGYAGETEMYKLRWKGQMLDTLEYISYEKDKRGKKTGKIIVSKHRDYDDKKEKTKRLNFIPKEYKKIEGYDWFTGEGY